MRLQIAYSLDVSDTVLLLCHGVLSRQSNEMSLMVASDDSLPTQHVIAAASPSERTHRLDWRLLREIEAPYVVFSAACSSGSILTEDLGEHVGIFGALRLCGTRAVVAPAWDVRANDVVPILEAVVLLYLRRGRSLIACLKEAGDQAGKHLPPLASVPLASPSAAGRLRDIASANTVQTADIMPLVGAVVRDRGVLGRGCGGLDHPRRCRAICRSAATGMREKVEIPEWAGQMVLAAHRTVVGSGLTAVTVETVTLGPAEPDGLSAAPRRGAICDRDLRLR